MYCTNCGKKVDEKAVVCVGCGCAIKNNIYSSKNKKGKGIASMVLGIISVFYSLVAFTLVSNLDVALYYYDGAEQLGYAIGLVLIQSVLATIGICLAVAERKNNKNGFNTSGLWLTLSTFIMSTIQFLIVICY